MKTTLNILDELVKKAMSLSNHRTKTGTVITALHEYIRLKKIERILAHEGKLDFDDTWEKSRYTR